MNRLATGMLSAMFFMHAAGMLYAQERPSLMGRHINIRPQLVHGIRGVLTGGSLAYTFDHAQEVSLGYHRFTSQIRQSYGSSDFEGDRSGVLFDSEMLDDPARVETRYKWVLEYRYYAGFHMLPAPVGSFFYARAESGKLDISGQYYEGVVQELDFDENGSIINYRYEGLDFMALEVGGGSSIHLLNRLQLMLSGGVQYYRPFPLNNFTAEVLQGVTRNYGGNLWAFSFGGQSSFGISFHAQLNIPII